MFNHNFCVRSALRRKIKGSFSLNQRAASRLLHMPFRSERKLKFRSCDLNACGLQDVSVRAATCSRRWGVDPACCPCHYSAHPPVCFPALVFLNASRCVPWSRSIIYDHPFPTPSPPTVQYWLSRCLNMLHNSAHCVFKLREMSSLPFSIFISFVSCCSVLLYYPPQQPPNNHPPTPPPRHTHTPEYERPVYLWIRSLHEPRCGVLALRQVFVHPHIQQKAFLKDDFNIFVVFKWYCSFKWL